MSIESLLAFSLAASLLVISPGPSNLYIMARSIAQGPKAGIAAAGGMAIGSGIFVLATAIGIAAVFSYSPLAYLLIKLAGAGYLVYLGVQYFRQADAKQDKQKVKPASYKHILKQSLIVELTNPKTALFFIAFLPQFVAPEAGNIGWQLLLLGVIYSAIGLCSDLFVAIMSGKLGSWLSQHSGFVYWQDRIAGGVLLSLGSYLAYDSLMENK